MNWTYTTKNAWINSNIIQLAGLSWAINSKVILNDQLDGFNISPSGFLREKWNDESLSQIPVTNQGLIFGIVKKEINNWKYII
jgi:hypothetical protein